MNNTNKTEYAALLVSLTQIGSYHGILVLTNGAQAALQPGQAVSVLNNRIQQIYGINTDIAGWLHVSFGARNHDATNLTWTRSVERSRTNT